MSEQPGIFTRIGHWFKGTGKTDPDAPLQGVVEPSEKSITFLRPWARRDQAINNLQHGFHTLTDLMGTIRDNLERQNQRQDQLLQYMAQLPEALQTLPESSRAHGETLRAIHRQMEHHSLQQKQLADILGRISESTVDQKESVEALHERLEVMRQHDQAISHNLTQVGNAMESIGKTSHASAQVLDQMRQNIDRRDDELERILQRQNTRFTTMLAVAIFLSIAALATVCILGYLLLNRPA